LIIQNLFFCESKPGMVWLRPLLAATVCLLIACTVGGYSWIARKAASGGVSWEPVSTVDHAGDNSVEAAESPTSPAGTPNHAFEFAGQERSGRRLLIVCSTTQVADFARQVVGDRCEVRSVLAAGQDPHLYELKTGDAELVARADLCLENGWHLEGKDWMRRLATQARRPLVTCVEGIAPLAAEPEAMEAEKPEAAPATAAAPAASTAPRSHGPRSNGPRSKGPESHGPGFDPHAWLSARNAMIYVRNIRDAVKRIDPRHSAEYDARARLYLEQLEQLDRWARVELSRIPSASRVLVTSHDAFAYFCRDYGLRSAAPTGWSTGEEIGGGATPERRRETVASIRKFGVKAIFVETSVNPKAVRSIAADAGVRIGGELYSDSMGPPGSAGETYLGMMRENIITIVEALR
jgi:manganese/iron transport system substrate-binding protein